jgi:hypothetical protein
MKRFQFTGLLATVALLIAALFAGTAKADPSEYGIASLSASQSTSQAGAHPDLTISFALKTETGTGTLPATTEKVVLQLPPGLAAYPGAASRCTTERLMSTDVLDPSNATGCPQDAQVGIAEAQLFNEIGNLVVLTEPLYSMTPPTNGKTVARFGFIGDVYPIVIDVSLRSEGDYGAEVTAASSASLIPLLGAETTVWGVPADPSHDVQRITAHEALYKGGAPDTPTGKRESGLAPAPFLSNPTRCGVARPLKLTVTSYAEPERPESAETSLPPISGCGKLEFEPELSLAPTSPEAAQPTGLDAETTLRQNETVGGDATSALRSARVVLPPELTVAAGAANGLAGCSEAQVGLGTREPAHCPDAAKVGVAEIDTPVLAHPLHGSVYQRQPTKGDLLGLWLVVDEQGLHLKLRGKVHADPKTGQITTIFDEGTPQSEGIPQGPVARFSLELFGGARAPIVARHCGTYSAHYEFTPWSGEATVTGAAPVTFDGNCDTSGFAPKLSGGSTEPLAGAFSTFATELSRESSEQEFSSFELTLPAGLSAKLAGVALCEGAAAQSGDCPAGSQVGRILAAAGPGPTPLWIPQPGKAPTQIYLSGPYKGAPYSIVAKVPAQAGPFDLGNVITRAALYIDPVTARATAVTDPLPRLLEGIPTSLREADVIVDRKNFMLNPTDCSAQQLKARVTSTEGAVATPTAPFGVGGCKGLPFKPSLSLHLKGKKTNRGGHPALRAVLRTRPGDANIGRIQAALPHSEFIDQAHFQTICTRVQFAAKQCPAGSVYGHVTATSPLLDFPLTGPVYLRSSSHELPDLVAVVRGPAAHPIEVNTAGRVDSVNGGIRTTFETFPDVPVSKAVLEMQGGKKGLFVNSRDICRFPAKAKVSFGGQNGKQLTLHPAMRADCG